MTVKQSDSVKKLISFDLDVSDGTLEFDDRYSFGMKIPGSKIVEVNISIISVIEEIMEELGIASGLDGLNVGTFVSMYYNNDAEIRDFPLKDQSKVKNVIELIGLRYEVADSSYENRIDNYTDVPYVNNQIRMCKRKVEHIASKIVTVEDAISKIKEEDLPLLEAAYDRGMTPIYRDFDIVHDHGMEIDEFELYEKRCFDKVSVSDIANKIMTFSEWKEQCVLGKTCRSYYNTYVSRVIGSKRDANYYEQFYSQRRDSQEHRVMFGKAEDRFLMDDLEWSQVFYTENVDKFLSGVYDWCFVECLLKTPTRLTGCHCHETRWCALCNTKSSPFFSGMPYNYDKAFFQTIIELNQGLFAKYISGLGKMCSIPSVVADVMLDMDNSGLVKFDGKVRSILLDIARKAKYYYANFGTPFNFDVRDDIWSIVYGRPWTAKWQNLDCKTRFLVKRVYKKSRVFFDSYCDDVQPPQTSKVELFENMESAPTSIMAMAGYMDIYDYPQPVMDIIKLLKVIQISKEMSGREQSMVHVGDTRVSLAGPNNRRRDRKKRKRNRKKGDRENK